MHSERSGSGSPLVLVHGLGSSLRTWDRVVPLLNDHRDVIRVDLPGFGVSPAMAGAVTLTTLTDALDRWLEGQTDAGVVGSSMGGRIVLESARRGRSGPTVALDPVGFWSPRQRTFFAVSVTASVALIRALRPALPFLSAHAATRTVLLPQFSARPWKLPADLVRQELEDFVRATSLDEALRDLVAQSSPVAADVAGRVTIGWGRQDKVTLRSQAPRAVEAFPGATLEWFDACGHFPHWDRPDEAARLILART